MDFRFGPMDFLFWAYGYFLGLLIFLFWAYGFLFGPMDLFFLCLWMFFFGPMDFFWAYGFCIFWKFGPMSGPMKKKTCEQVFLCVFEVETSAPMCICGGGMSGSIDGVAFNNHCQPQPTSDLLALKNDICFIET